MSLPCLLVALASEAEPYRFGPLGERLTETDLTAISKAVGRPEAPWAILGWSSHVRPEVRYADAFLPPDSTTARMIRGTVVRLRCTPTDSLCPAWVTEPAVGLYVQVSHGEMAPAPEPTVRNEIERPIRVIGQFTDEDLLGLVTCIRNGPSAQPPPGPLAPHWSKDVPIQDIERQANGSVRIRLTDDGAGGEAATVVRTRRGWQVTEVVHWVL